MAVLKYIVVRMLAQPLCNNIVGLKKGARVFIHCLRRPWSPSCVAHCARISARQGCAQGMLPLCRHLESIPPPRAPLDRRSRKADLSLQSQCNEDGKHLLHPCMRYFVRSLRLSPASKSARWPCVLFCR